MRPYSIACIKFFVCLFVQVPHFHSEILRKWRRCHFHAHFVLFGAIGILYGILTTSSVYRCDYTRHAFNYLFAKLTMSNDTRGSCSISKRWTVIRFYFLFSFFFFLQQSGFHANTQVYFIYEAIFPRNRISFASTQDPTKCEIHTPNPLECIAMQASFSLLFFFFLFFFCPYFRSSFLFIELIVIWLNVNALLKSKSIQLIVRACKCFEYNMEKSLV